MRQLGTNPAPLVEGVDFDALLRRESLADLLLAGLGRPSSPADIGVGIEALEGAAGGQHPPDEKAL